jgi:uncharacterized protein with FMN-binding domain
MKRICLAVWMIIITIAFVFSAAGENAPWDCPDCGRTGNTGSFCGGCGHAAPSVDSSAEASGTDVAVEAAEYGFGGDVTVHLIMDGDKVRSLTIDTSNETPRMGQRASEKAFTDQFIGKSAPFAYGKDGIEALTGATLTSNAALKAINRAAGVYSVTKGNSFSRVTVTAYTKNGKLTDVKIESEGDADLLTDEIREEWAKAILESGSASPDAITGASLKFSAESVQEAMTEILEMINSF